MSVNIMITAHSGCEGTPDNSMASIEKAVALGADCVEIDVRADGKGKLWLSHDLPEDYSGLVSLEAAFVLIRESGVAVNCDLKEYGALQPVLALADQFGIAPEKLIFSGSVDTALLETAPDIARRARIFINSEELMRDLMKTGLPDRTGQTAFMLAHPEAVADRLHALGAEALNVPYKHMPDELIAKLRARNVALSLWTLNDEAVLRAFMEKDLLNITTRNASAALRLRASMV